MRAAVGIIKARGKSTVSYIDAADIDDFEESSIDKFNFNDLHYVTQSSGNSESLIQYPAQVYYITGI